MCFKQFFSLHFVMKAIFYDRFEERIGLFIDLILKNTSCVFIYVEKHHLNENKFTLYKLYAVRWRVSSMAEGIQYGGSISSVSGGY